MKPVLELNAVLWAKANVFVYSEHFETELLKKCQKYSVERLFWTSTFPLVQSEYVVLALNVIPNSEDQ